VTRIVLFGLLGLAVLCAWLGAAGYLRLRNVLDRLHCVAFVNATVGLLLTIAAFVSDGASDRALKIALLTGIALVNGAVLSHATGRALLFRGALPDASRVARISVPVDPQREDPTVG
jgi:multicomponent Na+:H+ antiporter subunit G